ncbi:hypothetical protein SAMN03097699_1204 [Flavobacteriaceae bacterium MAR_2010_188]|nr:hypothetical protein SAMN03097699_1204 [Flavobacteriaceae bacterium MAR_2010_188]
MKKLLLLLSFFLIASFGYSQKRKEAQSIIKEDVRIKKYYNKAELEGLAKGKLLDLYIERVENLYNLLPYIAFATKPGTTMTTLGIPNDSDNRKILEDQFEASDDFLETNEKFQRQILPYSDTNDLISAILFYEDIMKSLHQYSELH